MNRSGAPARGDNPGADCPRRLKPGTVLLHEYQGERHTVVVVANVWREKEGVILFATFGKGSHANLYLVDEEFMDKTKAVDAARSQTFGIDSIASLGKSERTGLAMIKAIQSEAELFALAEQVDLAEKAFHDALARRNEAQIAYLREPSIMTREALDAAKTAETVALEILDMVNGITCRRRVAKLHGAGRYFLCRHCYRLAHASQSEGEWDRSLHRANKIRRRLGGEPGLASRFPDRPKGMWKRTYERLQDEVIDVEILAEEVFEIQAQRLLARIDRPSGKKKRSYWR